MMKQKQIRELQINEVNEKRKAEKRTKNEYEKQLVANLKNEIKAEKDKAIKKKEDYKDLAWDMFRENEVNKQIRETEK